MRSSPAHNQNATATEHARAESSLSNQRLSAPITLVVSSYRELEDRPIKSANKPRVLCSENLDDENRVNTTVESKPSSAIIDQSEAQVAELADAPG
jgi:hypothetical protein